MALIVATVFALAFLGVALSFASLFDQWPRVQSAIAARGEVSDRIVRVGPIKHTGQRLRLVVVNRLEDDEEQQVFNFADYKAA